MSGSSAGGRAAETLLADSGNGLASLMAQGLHRFKPAGNPGWDQGREDARDERAAANQDNVLGISDSGQLGKGIDAGGKKFQAGPPVHEMQEFVAELERQHSQGVARNHAD